MQIINAKLRRCELLCRHGITAAAEWIVSAVFNIWDDERGGGRQLLGGAWWWWRE